MALLDRRAVAALGVALASTLFCDDSLACSICLAGDPQFSSSGSSAQEAGSFSFYTEFRAWTKTSGELPGPPAEEPAPFEENEGQRLDFYLGWTPLDRLTFTLDLPIAFNEIAEFEAATGMRSELDGVGDLMLTGGFVLWRDRPVLPSRWLEARVFLKAPTGKSKQDVGGIEDPHLQLGTGSFDAGFGLAGAQRLAFASLYASAFYRENFEGSLGYRYGNVVLVNAAVEVPVGHALAVPWLEPLVAGFELNFRFAGYDHFQGLRYGDSGGSIPYATPSLRVRLPWLRPAKPPSLRFAVQVPLTQAWLNGFQEEGAVGSAGLLVPF